MRARTKDGGPDESTPSSDGQHLRCASGPATLRSSAAPLAYRKAEGGTDAHDIEECKLLLNQKKTESAEEQRRANNLLVLLDASGAARGTIFECLAAKNCRVGVEFEALSSALSKHGFVFTDPEIESKTVIGAVRERLHPFISEFARRQPFDDARGLLAPAQLRGQLLYIRASAKRYPFDECPNAPRGIINRPEDAAQLAGNRGDWMLSVGWRWID